MSLRLPAGAAAEGSRRGAPEGGVGRGEEPGDPKSEVAIPGGDAQEEAGGGPDPGSRCVRDRKKAGLTSDEFKPLVIHIWGCSSPREFLWYGRGC